MEKKNAPKDPVTPAERDAFIVEMSRIVGPIIDKHERAMVIKRKINVVKHYARQLRAWVKNKLE